MDKSLNKIPSYLRITLFIYGLALLLTFIIIKFPNGIQALGVLIFNFKIPFNWNHGFALLLTAIVGYAFFKTERKTNFLGNNKVRSIVFSLILLVSYAIVGISNKYEINPHLWALIFVSLTLIYDVLEESFWRGYLNDLIQPKHLAIKYTITGILWSFWHFLIFDNFEQWGGFHVFLMLSIIVSFIIGFATTKTNSILVAAAIHALLISKNLNVTIICFIIWSIMILTWNKKLFIKNT
ncbi:CPBP family intramembrane metalloprotease [Xanthomarina sp. F1114]|uniref:CPBP family intramembrane glutamic endopeptidase n=1 Tax=Xanthomarina sp. F1114 TaxID=2996019 RepID=UPI00225DEE0A|nr:CPBP family intramembrane glutamic endopeptidase [Xanthomarina sp. F1114]MCX7548628.1 CPBP family intramembrane metalloprotease [Xanthomarina sp. F1114]